MEARECRWKAGITLVASTSIVLNFWYDLVVLGQCFLSTQELLQKLSRNITRFFFVRILAILSWWRLRDLRLCSANHVTTSTNHILTSAQFLAQFVGNFTDKRTMEHVLYFHSENEYEIFHYHFQVKSRDDFVIIFVCIKRFYDK